MISDHVDRCYQGSFEQTDKCELYRRVILNVSVFRILILGDHYLHRGPSRFGKAPNSMAFRPKIFIIIIIIIFISRMLTLSSLRLLFLKRSSGETGAFRLFLIGRRLASHSVDERRVVAGDV